MVGLYCINVMIFWLLTGMLKSVPFGYLDVFASSWKVTSLNSGIKLIVVHNLPPANDTRHQTPDGNIIDITIIQENCLSFTAPPWTKVCFTMFTVGPSLTATSQQTATALQRPLFLADSPYVDSCLRLSTTATFFFPKVAVCGEFKLYHLTKGGYSCS